MKIGPATPDDRAFRGANMRSGSADKCPFAFWRSPRLFSEMSGRLRTILNIPSTLLARTDEVIE